MATFSLSSYFSVRLLAVPVMPSSPDAIDGLALLGAITRSVDYRDRLHFEKHFWLCQTHYRDQRASGKIVTVDILPDVDELITESRVRDENCHGDDVSQRSSGLFKRFGDPQKNLSYLTCEIPCQRCSG